MREEGYYWVKEYSSSQWEIATWNGYYFFLPDDHGDRTHEKNLFTINETRIKNPDEK